MEAGFSPLVSTGHTVRRPEGHLRRSSISERSIPLTCVLEQLQRNGYFWSTSLRFWMILSVFEGVYRSRKWRSPLLRWTQMPIARSRYHPKEALRLCNPRVTHALDVTVLGTEIYAPE